MEQVDPVVDHGVGLAQEILAPAMSSKGRFTVYDVQLSNRVTKPPPSVTRALPRGATGGKQASRVWRMTAQISSRGIV